MKSEANDHESNHFNDDDKFMSNVTAFFLFFKAF